MSVNQQNKANAENYSAMNKKGETKDTNREQEMAKSGAR